MDRNTYIKELYKCFQENGLGSLLDDAKAEKLFRFSVLLIETNKQFNLTAITDEKDIMLKHFVDCASISPLIPKASKIIDVGCGAGFPSVPLAILRDDVEILALDSTAKRIAFVDEVARELDLAHLSAECARAEDFAKDHRESFDICASRAVARLNILSELCIPLVKVGGNFIAMKSIQGDQELIEAKQGIKLLGADLEIMQQDKFTLGDNICERVLFSFKKSSKTPPQYPRKYSQILKKPL